jgi:type II secretory pathway pseudopilin PulG
MSGDGGGAGVPPRLVVLAGRKGRPSLLPFVGVLLVLLSLGLVGLLLLNTALNQGAFKLRQKQSDSTKLTQEAEQYQQELAKLSEPGALASRAQQLGMVPAGNPAFLDPAGGTILGSPTPAARPTTAPTPTPSASPTSSPSPTPSAVPTRTVPTPATSKPTPTSPPSPTSPTGAGR